MGKYGKLVLLTCCVTYLLLYHHQTTTDFLGCTDMPFLAKYLSDTGTSKTRRTPVSE